MKKVGSREFKNRQGYYLRRVRRGETLLVTIRRRPVAKIEPVAGESAGETTLEERLQELAAQGHLRLATGKPRRFKPVTARGKPASQMIIEDRG